MIRTRKCEASDLVVETQSKKSKVAGPGNDSVSTADLEGVSRTMRERKAVKSDDADTPEFLWMEHLVDDGTRVWEKEELVRLPGAMRTGQGRLLRRWKLRLTRSFLVWMVEKYKTPWTLCTSESSASEEWNEETGFYVWKSGTRLGRNTDGLSIYKQWWTRRRLLDDGDLVAGGDAIGRAADATWWNWDAGSRPFHWRWPEWYQFVIRDGMEVYLTTAPPRYRVPQRDIYDPKIKVKVVEKLTKVRGRRYIGPLDNGQVTSLTSFFPVQKGDDDIRMVYDGSVSGLTDAMWVPRFTLLTIESHLRAVEEGTFMADVDVGECFLNFILHKDIRALCGVHLTHYVPMENNRKVWISKRQVWV